MMFVLHPGADQEKIKSFINEFEEMGFSPLVSEGTERTVIGLVGNTKVLDVHSVVETHDIVSYGKRITEPYKLVNRAFHPDDTKVRINNIVFGEGGFQVISGPCSVENEDQIIQVARAVKESGATILRGGAYKPRSSPYSFQGLHQDGLRLLSLAKKETGLPIITEMTNMNQLEYFDDVDIIQIGARNMQNFDLLKEVGKCRKPVLLKRGLYNTIEEFLMSAEYIMAGGNEQIILCERGIRTIETMTRNTLDISAVPLLKKVSHLPVVIDPSHAAGIRSMVSPLSKASIAVGADGLMIETHNDPAKALCDGAQSLDLKQFDELMKEIRRRVEFEGKTLG
ncbi:3-deoxy-7-phosphoheptulonate synthase [Anaerobium acetethylicum]|uniref:3-deoxy-D-arabinoheptulosonate-7-phosphate synthase n=1 Tax=Anaerobium acetethylicum TaxID=1619234 RepID=A0A1D3TZ34_9FIRM|nr:3-deoxy-7-phosphoheptulonate synthase [Anaerobium acetethylicum]SCP99783.1 3-deoxy-D-arabinoheptulosonate-7-phosphate synthase [Anaerobium acetethylicum]